MIQHIAIAVAVSTLGASNPPVTFFGGSGSAFTFIDIVGYNQFFQPGVLVFTEYSGSGQTGGGLVDAPQNQASAGASAFIENKPDGSASITASGIASAQMAPGKSGFVNSQVTLTNLTFSLDVPFQFSQSHSGNAVWSFAPIDGLIVGDLMFPGTYGLAGSVAASVSQPGFFQESGESTFTLEVPPGTVVNDGFSDGVLQDWDVTLESANSWQGGEVVITLFPVPLSWLYLDSIDPAVINPGGGGEWAFVNFTRQFSPLQDFDASALIRWDECFPAGPAMQLVWLQLLDAKGGVSTIGFYDAWIGHTGGPVLQVAGWPAASDSDALPLSGEALVRLSRTGTTVTATWNNQPLETPLTYAEPIVAARLKFGYYAYQGNSISCFGDEYVEFVHVHGTAPNPADLNGDQLVDIDDLFIAIGAWGDCPDPCPPSCIGDISGNCQVDIDDLFILIGAWS